FVGRHRPGDELPDGVLYLLLGALGAGLPLGEDRPDRLEEAYVVTDSRGLRVRDGESEGLRECPDDLKEAGLPILLREHVLLPGREQSESLLRRPGFPARP